MLLFLLLLLFSFGIVFLLLRPTRTETAVQQQLVDIQDTRAEQRGETILKVEGYSSNPEISSIVREIPGSSETLVLIRQAGLTWTVAFVMGISVVAAIATAWISSLFLPGLVLALVAGVIAGAIPYIYILVMRELRFRKCDQLLPEAIDLMARGLRAGHALSAVLEMVADEIADPISTEFRRLHEENSLGIPLREATMNLVSRLPRDDMRFLATAILLQKETGSNLAVILDKTSAVARERARLRGQLRIYTAQGRITGWILCVMPLIMFGLLSTVNWNLEKLLITEHAGRVLVYTGLCLMGLGILVIRRIINVKV
ncbi:MAG: type II secretion system F family protein [Acidobacteria bacterium]|nr:type II secretion system F family protein [Acidobacteriota bacterium]